MWVSYEGEIIATYPEHHLAVLFVQGFGEESAKFRKRSRRTGPRSIATTARGLRSAGFSTYEYNGPPFFCESCQMQFGMGQQVELADGLKLLICDLCWNQIPPAQRIKLAEDFRQNAIDAAGQWLKVLKRMLAIADAGQAAGTGGIADRASAASRIGL